MTNPYYSATGNPATGAQGLSALMRSEFTLISAAFDKLPPLAGGGLAVVINPGGTAMTVTAGTLALGGNLSISSNFTTTGAFNTTLAQGASVTLTLPVVSGTLATLAGTETLTNKTLVAPALGTPVSCVATNFTGTAAGLTVGNATNATNLSNGSVAATTISASGAVSGDGFTALFASPPSIGNSAAASGAFTTLSASSTVSGSGFTARFASPGPIGNTVAASGSFTTINASGLITPTSTIGIQGTTTNDSAPSGSIGEYISSTVLTGAAVALTSGTAANVTTIAPGGGDWDISGSTFYTNIPGTAVNVAQGWISTVSATPPTSGTSGYSLTVLASGAIASGHSQTIGSIRESYAGSTTTYLSAFASFASGTCSAYGFIGARRRR